MKNLELQKRANDVRKGIVTTSSWCESEDIPVDPCQPADIFTFLYFEEMNIDPKNPDMEERDRFVLSKGHTAPGLYSALAYRGYFPVEDLPTLRHLGSYLQGSSLHPYPRRGYVFRIPGTGGISAAVGWHWVQRWRIVISVYTHCWVTVRSRKARYGRQPCSAGFRKLDNLCVMVDNNNLPDRWTYRPGMLSLSYR